jgi:hypothetical protein
MSNKQIRIDEIMDKYFPRCNSESIYWDRFRDVIIRHELEVASELVPSELQPLTSVSTQQPIMSTPVSHDERTRY